MSRVQKKSFPLIEAQPSPQKAFIDQVFEHQGILYRICSIYGETVEDRKDLYQDILFQLWKSFNSFNGQSKFSTWMYRVALNIALLSRRKHTRRKKYFSKPDELPEFAFEENDQKDEDVTLLYRSIQELPELDRAVILLYLEQYTYQEIADITGLSRSNVSVRIVRIKEKLQKRLRSMG